MSASSSCTAGAGPARREPCCWQLWQPSLPPRFLSVAATRQQWLGTGKLAPGVADSRQHRSSRRLQPLAARTGARAAAPEAGKRGWPLLARQAAAMFAAGATLGPLCDGLHSSSNVLHYARPVLLGLPGTPLHLETCWWVPVLFGVAGVILGLAHPALDDWRAQAAGQQGPGAAGDAPGWGVVLLGIAVFVCQYGASGQLEAPLLGHTAVAGLPSLDAMLALLALAHWAMFDGTRQGLGMAVLTAAAGPLLEVALINGAHLYHYSHPAVAGVPTWIPWVYFCGSPAVGNLGRRVRVALAQGH